MTDARSIRSPHPLARAALAIALLLALSAGGSYWFVVGHTRLDQMWQVVPANGMAELHSQRRGWTVAGGNITWVEHRFLSAVVPRWTAENSPAASSSEWVLTSAPTQPERVGAPMFFFTNWHEWRLWSLGCYTTTVGGTSSHVVSVPMWLLALLLCLPRLWIWQRGRVASRRLRAGACWVCGYAGVGRQPGARCPECGATRPA